MRGKKAKALRKLAKGNLKAHSLMTMNRLALIKKPGQLVNPEKNYIKSLKKISR